LRGVVDLRIPYAESFLGPRSCRRRSLMAPELADPIQVGTRLKFRRRLSRKPQDAAIDQIIVDDRA
jgi:hypothetical protein